MTYNSPFLSTNFNHNPSIFCPSLSVVMFNGCICFLRILSGNSILLFPKINFYQARLKFYSLLFLFFFFLKNCLYISSRFYSSQHNLSEKVNLFDIVFARIPLLFRRLRRGITGASSGIFRLIVTRCSTHCNAMFDFFTHSTQNTF